MNWSNMNIPFAAKYRPLHLRDVIGNESICDKLKGYIGKQYVPHMLFVGDSGTGKNTIAECFIRDYLGDLYNDHQHYYSLDGSIYRKRDHISSDKSNERDLKSFIRINVNPLMTRRMKRSTKSHKRKLILIRDFHCMTEDAQTALRTLMEKYAESTSFILTCNNQDEIVEAIQSRATPLVFSPVDHLTIVKVLSQVSAAENYNVSSELLAYIADLSQGKIGMGLNHLQMCNRLSAQDAANMFDINIRSRLLNIIQDAHTKPIKIVIDKLLVLNHTHGYQPVELCNLILDVIQLSDDLDITDKFKLLRKLSLLTLIVIEDESSIYLRQIASIMCSILNHR